MEYLVTVKDALDEIRNTNVANLVDDERFYDLFLDRSYEKTQEYGLEPNTFNLAVCSCDVIIQVVSDAINFFKSHGCTNLNYVDLNLTDEQAQDINIIASQTLNRNNHMVGHGIVGYSVGSMLLGNVGALGGMLVGGVHGHQKDIDNMLLLKDAVVDIVNRTFFYIIENNSNILTRNEIQHRYLIDVL